MKKLLIVLLLAASLVLLSACGLDVIANDSAKSFDALLSALPTGAKMENGSLTLPAPDGSAQFILKTDWPGDMDAYLSVDAAPLEAAGLDTTKLSKAYLKEGDRLLIGLDLVDGTLAGDTPLKLYNSLIAKRPDILGYHVALGHFGLSLGGGMFEWAKDLTAGDKDMVFVLDPTPLEAAGLKPEAAQGWAYAQIETMDAYGAKIKVMRLLKPFNLI